MPATATDEAGIIIVDAAADVIVATEVVVPTVVQFNDDADADVVFVPTAATFRAGETQMFSLGLSLPTGWGLSAHGDASRDTDSESSSLKTVPVKR